ncbi:hypothetical protein M0813_13873 [Anaeramoeba flamelloides]|uniref:Uncharacterized protein n=1 Tax=Anaeramoeba flamelloides TaxID=1746091 RepID=A0ABQ8Z7M8_9EUKA|nr:hypothetical protein M0813_13873 [Anaeramoeba flamelloides]
MVKSELCCTCFERNRLPFESFVYCQIKMNEQNLLNSGGVLEELPDLTQLAIIQIRSINAVKPKYNAIKLLNQKMPGLQF